MKDYQTDKIRPEERPPVLRIIVRSDEDVFDELREQTDQLVEQGTDTRTLAFGRVSDLRSLLTDRRVEIVQSIMDEPPASIAELANRLNRDYRTVYEDIETLRGYDIVYFGEGKGRGKRPYIPYEKVEIGGTLAEVAAA